MEHDIAAYVAEYHGTDGLLTPYGFGETVQRAQMDARKQIAGASDRMRAFMRPRIIARGVGAEEASELAEYFATPWCGPQRAA
jgi:hypothetical protein